MEEVNHYYPYGGLFGEGISNSKQAYKYSGKELDRMHGLDWYDFGARYLRSDVLSWTGVDPLCEKSYSISPYAYCLNNPLKYTDPDGRLPILLIPLIKGTIGALIDAGAQVAVSMANDKILEEQFQVLIIQVWEPLL